MSFVNDYVYHSNGVMLVTVRWSSSVVRGLNDNNRPTLMCAEVT